MNGEWGDLDLFSDGGVFDGPAFPGLVRQEQDAGALALPLGVALGLALAGQCLALGLTNDVLLGGHG